MTSVAQQFNVGRLTVHDIVKNEAKLKRFVTEIEERDCIKKRKIVRRPDKAVISGLFSNDAKVCVFIHS